MANDRAPVRPRSVIVIGAGIVGVSCALWLQRDAHSVIVLDPREPGDGASFGNAGVIATNSVAPIAMPNIVRRLPRLLFDRNGPVSVRLSYLPQIAPFLVRLVRATRRARLDEISSCIAAPAGSRCFRPSLGSTRRPRSAT
jgi:glycine/D-amino acid oxidase-like deaminating enzyme